MNSVIILPVRNPEYDLTGYIRDLAASGVKKFIVVDDGSSDEYDPVFSEIRQIPECDLITLEDKTGVAWALKDAMEYYLKKGYDKDYGGVVYVEPEGMYSYTDIDRVSETMEEKPDSLILGERRFDDNVDKNKKIGNRITIMILSFLYGVKTKDPQTGLRGFPNKIIPSILKIEGVDYQYMINMEIESQKHRIPIVSVKNEAVSTDSQVFTRSYPKKNAGFIYKGLMVHFIKYIVSALVSFALDVTLFQIFVGILEPHHDAYILMSTIFARAISSVWTFTFNRKVVFHSNDNLPVSLLKFYGLVAIQMLASGGLVTVIFRAIKVIPEAVIKVIVDFTIFLISYKVEKTFIFRQKL